ncbi:MAG: hypothetical protein ACQKBU_07120 [Verrucomicrobiales bacterium]
MKIRSSASVGLLCTAMCSSTFASTIFLDSPTSWGELPPSISPVGGIVADLVGDNDSRLVAQLPASSLFVGYSGLSQLTIGTQAGFSESTILSLGGGIKEASFRLTLYDGDTSPGNFDFNENLFLVNGQSVQNFSEVTTTSHNSSGDSSGYSSQLGFPNNGLATGFFYTDDSATLAAIYNSLLSTGDLLYQLEDSDPGDNYFDFTQGIDASLIDTETAPTAFAPVPEPSNILSLAGLLST